MVLHSYQVVVGSYFAVVDMLVSGLSQVIVTLMELVQRSFLMAVAIFASLD